MKKLLFLLLLVPFLFACDNDDNKKTNEISFFKLDDSKKTFSIGEIYQFRLDNFSAFSAYSWESTEKSVAIIDENGLMKTLKGGKTTIKVTLPALGFTDALEIMVLDNEVNSGGIYLSETVKRMQVGENAKLTYTLESDSDKDKYVTWGSSDSTIATVDQEGNVKALKEGVTVITVGLEDGKKVSQCTLNVKAVDSDEHVLLYLGNISVQVNNDEIDAKVDVFIKNRHNKEITDAVIDLKQVNSTTSLAQISLGTIEPNDERGFVATDFEKLGEYVLSCTYKYEGKEHKVEEKLSIQVWNPWMPMD